LFFDFKCLIFTAETYFFVDLLQISR